METPIQYIRCTQTHTTLVRATTSSTFNKQQDRMQIQHIIIYCRKQGSSSRNIYCLAFLFLVESFLLLGLFGFVWILWFCGFIHSFLFLRLLLLGFPPLLRMCMILEYQYRLSPYMARRKVGTGCRSIDNCPTTVHW